jgi:hypothetical protein
MEGAAQQPVAADEAGASDGASPLNWVFGRQMRVTPESRHALSRATLFLEKAKACPPDERVEFEAFLEASIVFARAAIHRLQSKYRKHSKWKAVWDSWAPQPAVLFFWRERNWILKEAPPRLGQKVFAASIGSRRSAPQLASTRAAEFYYYEGPETPATVTVERHLVSLKALLTEAERALEP